MTAILELVEARAEVEVHRVSGHDDLNSSGGHAGESEEATFEVRERWEGVVEELYDSYFVASIANLSNSMRATVELLIDDVSDHDKPFLIPGSLFFWHVGHRKTRDGQKERVSSLIFRRGTPLHRRSMNDALKQFWLTRDEDGQD